MTRMTMLINPLTGFGAVEGIIGVGYFTMHYKMHSIGLQVCFWTFHTLLFLSKTPQVGLHVWIYSSPRHSSPDNMERSSDT